MSVLKDKHIELCGLWHEAFANYRWFRKQITDNRWTEDDGVALGEYYGMMCGLANAEKHLFDMTTLWDEFYEYEEKYGAPIFKRDFEVKESS